MPMTQRISRRTLLDAALLALGIATAGAASALADEEIEEADKIRQAEALSEPSQWPAALRDLPAIPAARQVQARARADHSQRLVPIFRCTRERTLASLNRAPRGPEHQWTTPPPERVGKAR
jgi:hypothetical protein